MKVAGIVCLSLLGGVVGGVGSRMFFAPPVAQSQNHEIHLADGTSECDLTSRGLHVKWNDGREVRIEPSGVSISSTHHYINLAATDLKEIDAAFLVMDGKVWHAPSRRDRNALGALIAGLAGVGEIDLKQVEPDQPQ